MRVSSYLNSELDRLRGDLYRQAHEVIQLRADLAAAQDRAVKAEAERDVAIGVKDIHSSHCKELGRRITVLEAERDYIRASYERADADLNRQSKLRHDAEAELTAAREEIRRLLGHLEASNAAARRRGGERDAMCVALEQAPCGCTCAYGGEAPLWISGVHDFPDCKRVFCACCLALGLDKVKGEPDATAS